MPGKRPRPFLRTSSRPQLLQGCGYESPPPSPAAVKYPLGAPHRVVVGFDVGGAENSTKPHLDTCESPRSVLEPDALHDHPRRSPALALALADPAPSPRSVLDRSLLSGPESLPPRKEGVGLGIIAAIRREEPAVRKTTFDISVRGKPTATSEQISAVYPQNCAFKEGRTSTRASFSRDVNFSDDEDDDHEFAAVQDSIFCAASPFSHCCSLDVPSGDFLSACFFCKCCLMPGKDIFMYRGDRAFCSLECRYQQIVIDELKERHSAATNCYPVPPPRNNKVRTAAPSGLS